MSKSLSIIVPAFNEFGNVSMAVNGVIHAAARAGLARYELILVNDGSTDRTGEIMDFQARNWPDVHVVHHSTNQGLRAAYETGLALARHEYVTWIPGDGEMSTESIEAIFCAVGAADLVVPYHGTPERRTWLRRLLTWGSTTQLNWLLGHPLHYWQGTVVYPTALARQLSRTEAGFFFNAEMLAHALDRGLSYVEIPLVHTDRQHGVSKAVSARAIWRAQCLIARLWWRLRVQPIFEALHFAVEHR